MTNTETNTTESSVSDTVAALKGIPTRDELMETLRKEVLEVTFKKLDGDERKMPCTLITSFLPPAKKDDLCHKKKFEKYLTRSVQYGLLKQKVFVASVTTV